MCPHLPAPLISRPPCLDSPAAVWAWGGGICDIPPKVNLPLPRELKYGFRQHRTPGQLQFYVSV